jgi:hypothetical protein
MHAWKFGSRFVVLLTEQPDSSARSTPTVAAVSDEGRMLTGRVSAERWDRALDEVLDPRDPPVPVEVWLGMDARWWDGELHGWAPNPNGSSDELRGLVRGVREYAPGFWAEFLTWATIERVRQRDAG